MTNAGTIARRMRLWRGALAAIAIMAVPAAAAQTGAAQPASGSTGQGVPNALQGFSQNRSQPVKIESSSLEVRDKDKIATFIGNVHLTQGDTVMRSKILVVFYDQDPAPGPSPGAMKTEPQSGGGSQQIRKLEAKGGVIVTQKDQTATGDNGLFDMKSNTVTLTGNVVVTQCQNVIRGEKLIVDLTTGVSRVEAGKGRVEGLFASKGQPSAPGAGSPATSTSSAAPCPTSASAPAPAPAPAKPAGPMKLN